MRDVKVRKGQGEGFRLRFGAKEIAAVIQRFEDWSAEAGPRASHVACLLLAEAGGDVAEVCRRIDRAFQSRGEFTPEMGTVYAKWSHLAGGRKA